jgi:hypothetical protein
MMTRHLFFMIALIGTGALLNSPAEAQHWRCEDRAANCLGRCTDRAAGISDWGHAYKCFRCDRQLIKCMRNANMRWHRSY